MNHLRNILIALTMIFGASAVQADSSINAPLTAEHQTYIFNNAPFLVQPKCNPSQQIPCLVDQDDDDPTNNGEMSKNFTVDTPASIDMDLVSTGLVDILIYQFNRPSSKHSGYDGEAVVVFKKRDRIGDIFKEKLSAFKFETAAVRTNAHGGAPDLAGSAKYANVIGPNYANVFKSWGWSLISSEARTQLTSNGRIADLLNEKSDDSNSHPVVLSDDGNALIPVSDRSQLGKDFDGPKTVIFYPTMKTSDGVELAADTAELKKNFPTAKFRPYSINTREWSKNAIRLHNLKKDFFGDDCKSSAKTFTNLDGTGVITIEGIGSEARINERGGSSGANFWHGWTNIEIVDLAGNLKADAKTPKSYKDGLDRIPLIYSQEIVERTFNGLLTPEEKAAGGSRVVRNGFMKDVK